MNAHDPAPGGATGAPPRVSVITIFLNGEKYLAEAIDSVLAQTYDSWELLLVDDGSTDGSTVIARRYAEAYPARVRYLEHPGHENRGASASRNLGFRHARGEYIAFLDADDVFLANKLEDQVPLLDSLPEVAMLYGRSRLWFSWSGDPKDRHRDKLTRAAPRLNEVFQPPELAVANLRADDEFYPVPCSVLIRREAIEAVGGCEESFRNTFEDMVLFLKLLLHFPAYVSAECWDRYRRHPDSCWAVAMESGEFSHWKPYPARERLLTWLEQYLASQQMQGTETWKELQRQLWPYRHPRLHWPVSLARVLPSRVRANVERASELLPSIPVRKTIRRLLLWPPRGWIRFGSFRRIRPISQEFGFDRGTPIDRYFIEAFLARHADDVRGHVLEIGDDAYTRRFGAERVTRTDVLHVDAANPYATFVGDLQDADHIPSDRFDCIVFTQTLQYIYDARAAVRTLYRILKPGGVLLATIPGLSETGDDYSGAAWHWSFTPASTRRLFAEVFPRENVEVRSRGNVFAAVAFLHGVAVEEVSRKKLDYHDPRYVVTNTLRAVKPMAAD